MTGAAVSLEEVLGRHTPLPVHPAENGVVLQPGHVYVGPPQMILEVRPDGRCAVTSPEGELSRERPLDRLKAHILGSSKAVRGASKYRSTSRASPFLSLAMMSVACPRIFAMEFSHAASRSP